MLLSRGAEEEPPAPKLDPARVLCSLCFGEKGPGLPHQCRPAAKQRNLLGHLQAAPTKEQEAILGSAVKFLAKAQNPTLRVRGTSELSLWRVGGGHPIGVHVGRVDKKEVKLTAATFRRVEVEMDISRGSLLKLKQILKEEVPVESGVGEAFREWDKKGADQLSLHKVTNFELKVAAKKSKKGEKGTPARVEVIARDIVVAKDVKGLVNWVAEQRGMRQDNTVVRIYIDSGGGSLKVSASVQYRNRDSVVNILLV